MSPGVDGAILVLGTPDVVRGFGLEGIQGVTPASGGELEDRLAAAAAAKIVVLSPEIAALAPRAVAAAQARPEGPRVLVLPEGGERADAGERGRPDRGRA